MRMAWEELSEELLKQPCRFPTSARNHPQRSRFQQIGISDRKGQSVEWINCSESLEDIVKAVWAVLLHFYVQTDLVSFAACHDSSPSDTSVKGSKTGILHDNVELSILQYLVRDDLRLRDLHPIEIKGCRIATLGNEHINTAIHFSDLLPSQHGKENGHVSRKVHIETDNYNHGVRCC